MNTLHLVHNSATPANHQPTLKELVSKLVRRYLQDLGPSQGNDLYHVLLAEVEPALLTEVLTHCRGNQSRAAEALGLNRATLRKKLNQYQIDIN